VFDSITPIDGDRPWTRRLSSETAAKFDCVGSGYPAQEVYAAGRSYAAYVDRLKACGVRPRAEYARTLGVTAT
jgi:hypothetical protein